jgi:putative nucleotidyltransferase with HDIG domain
MENNRKFELYLQKLPVIPEVATKIMGIAEEGKHISFQQLEDIIKIDPGLTAKILKVANSALYARQREISTLQMAITLLGFKNIKSLVILTSASTLFTKGPSSSFYEHFWRHSVMSAFLTRELLTRNFSNLSADEGFLAGLLHDIGQVAMYHADPQNYQVIFENRETAGSLMREMEKEYFDVTHKEIGEKVLSRWNFPQVFIDTAKEHGMVNITSEHRTFILAVSIADILADSLVFGSVAPAKQELLENFMQYTDLAEKEIEYFKTEFREKLTEDPLFKECQHLFQFSYTV